VTTDLHTKYRPADWDAVIGQDGVVKSVRTALKKKSCRSFIFVGPSGVGKTTIARIIATEVNCPVNSIIEVDAASHSGVEGMRDIVQLLQFNPLTVGISRVIILDEVQSLSKAAWQSLLKSVEEPPPGTYWVFCTTESSKIPKTIETRSLCYELKPVKSDLIFDLLSVISEEENLGVDEKIINHIASRCDGSPRKAITALSKCSSCTTLKEAAELLKTSSEDGEVIDLCRALLKGGLTWEAAMKLITPLEGQNPEGIRIVIITYLSSTLKGTKSDQTACRILQILDAFVNQYYGDSFASLIHSIGKVIFGEDE
jgi:DNA polymerase-3 subunit gamma/tau